MFHSRLTRTPHFYGVESTRHTVSITVIIVNFNSGDLLRRCLGHLRDQTVLPQRICIVDNASTDGSACIPDLSENEILIPMSVNTGFAAGNNYALRECTTEYVALLNPDAFPRPDWLENLLIAAKNHPNVAALGSRQICDEDTAILDGIGDVYHVSGIAWRKGHGRRQESGDLIPREIFSPCAAAALYRREALNAIGGFDEDFFCYFEDVDLGFRLRLAGYKALYVPDAVVRHVGSATTGGQRSAFSVYHGHRNMVWAYIKNMPGILFWAFLPFHGLANLLGIIVYLLRGHVRTLLRSKKDALTGLGKMWKKRKTIQRSRSAALIDIWKALSFRCRI